MGTYGINQEEFLEGHFHITKNEDDYYGFVDFLRDFEGDVSAETVAEAWNHLASEHEWHDRLKVMK